MKEVSHEGRIVAVGRDVTKVEIISKSACASCHAAGLCTAFESAKKEVEVPTSPGTAYKVGDSVNVVMRRAMGNLAVLLAYIIPLFVLLILVLTLSASGVGELCSGLAALGGVVLYYAVLYLFRGRLASRTVFYIDRNDN